MTPKEFKQRYYPEIVQVCRETGLNPLFVAAQAALETGWAKNPIGNNLFGITAGKDWKGKTQTKRTFEYLKDANQGAKFPKVYSIAPLPDGRYKYTVDRLFRDYDTFAECLRDHFKVLQLPRYRECFRYADDVKRFAYAVAAAGYCTAKPEVYADSISKIAKMIERA